MFSETNSSNACLLVQRLSKLLSKHFKITLFIFLFQILFHIMRVLSGLIAVNNDLMLLLAL